MPVFLCGREQKVSFLIPETLPEFWCSQVAMVLYDCPAAPGWPQLVPIGLWQLAGQGEKHLLLALLAYYTPRHVLVVVEFHECLCAAL